MYCCRCACIGRAVLGGDTIAYTHDELGRVIQRTINGTANQVDWTFDALGRVGPDQNWWTGP